MTLITMKYTITIIHLSFLVLIVNLVECRECPDAKHLIPCTCNSSTIVCGGDELIDMEPVFEKLNKKLSEEKKHFYELIINNTAITELKENLVKDLQFYSIFIHEAINLKTIHPDAFKGTAKYTKIFVIKKCRKYNDPKLWDILSNFENIETISIGNIDLNEIPANIFKPMPKLYSIAFTGPNFDRVGELAFHELNTIRFIDFINTSISYIPDNIFVFKHSDIKVHIGLFYNQLDGSSFSPGAFADIGRVAEFHYMGFTEDENSDRIKFLDQKAFEPFLKANKNNEIHLRYEVIDCNDCRNKWLKDSPEYAKRVIQLRCSNQRTFDSTDNFATC